MKKILFLVIGLLLLCGCSNKSIKEEKKDTIKEKNVQEKEIYNDSNETPIGIYFLNGNTLNKVHEFKAKPVVEELIGTFQIYPSNDETIVLNNSFGQSFYDEWHKYSNIKLGFNIKFDLSSGEKISYNILGPGNTFDKWEYLMNYLYDDYANIGKNFYSHIENDQVNENTLYTAFKMQSSYSVDQISSKIEFMVFTYDSEDDFKNGEYQGNSSYKIDICLENRPC